MNNNTIIIILAGILIAAVLFLAAALLTERRVKSRNAVKEKHGSGKNFWYSSYLYFSRLFITRNYIARVRRRIQIMELADNWTIGRSTMKFAFMSFLPAFLVFIILAVLGRDLYFLVIAILTAVIVHDQILGLFVDRVENKIMVQFERFLGDVRHNFHEHGMIDEAIFDSIEDCGYEMSLHAHRIYEILTANDVEEEIEKYNEVAPNKFFKTFIALCQTILRFDDRKVDDKSMFLTNLNYLKQEINIELLKRQKLNYLFKSLSIISMAPIFAIKPLEMWAVANLPELIKYYKGAYGFVEPIILFALVILSYQFINKLQSNVQSNRTLSVLEDKLLSIRLVSKAMGRLVDANYSKAARYTELLKNTASESGVNAFYLKRIIYGSVAFVISLFMFFNVYSITRYNIINSVGADMERETQSTNKEAADELRELDRGILLKYKGTTPTLEQIQKEVQELGGIRDGDMSASASERIYKKLVSYNNQYFKWWQLLICFLIAFMAYNIPYLILVFRKKVLQMGMEDEVMQFHSIIIMLMYIERISVDNILQWMEQFAVIFKASIGRCINNFEHGDIEALEQLKIDEPFLPFTRLVENLQAASDKISVQQAFDELIIERGYYQEKRKQDNEIMIANKAMYGKIIAFTPLIATLLLHLLIPFLLESMNQLLNYSQQLKDVL